MASIIEYKGKKPTLGERVFLAEGVRLIGDVVIGDDSSVFYNTVIRADLAEIRIGSRTNIQDNSTLHLSSLQGVHIGDDVTVGHNAVLHACTIDDNVLVGMGAIIMDGAHIKSDSVVAAGALVPQGKEFPSKSLIVGVPARIARSLTEEEIRSFKQNNEHYIEIKNELLNNMSPDALASEDDGV
ncbi:MAG: gamma carbonic anhydrase family protein [Fibrobacter sp.]|nr:gamma carbonic anhydrase family protein [Fibrobacter sp.]